MFDISSRVIVRVWTSVENKFFPGHNVGHISIETNDLYMSLWPVPFTEEQIKRYRRAGTLEQIYLKYFMERDPNFHQTLEDDIAAEGNIAPEIVVCLYSLQHYSLYNEFDKIKHSTQGWRLVGRNLFFQKLECIIGVETVLGRRGVDSCVSLARSLLVAGGIEHLISLGRYSTFGSQTSSSIEVDDILKILIPAKLEELRKFPMTQGFVFPTETSIEKLKSYVSSKCVIL